MDRPGPDTADRLAAWADRLQAIARLGLHYAADDFDRERYRQVLTVAAEMSSAVTGLAPAETVAAWARDVGHVTPKVGGEAAVFDEAGRLLLLRRADSGLWALPGGWSEVGETAAETAAREAREEVGLVVRPRRLIGLFDSRRRSSRGPHHFYQVVFWCEVVGGGLTTTAEALEVGYFAEAALPELTPSHRRAVADAFEARRGRAEAAFDL